MATAIGPLEALAATYPLTFGRVAETGAGAIGRTQGCPAIIAAMFEGDLELG